jgi:hypothetical protein
LHRGGQKLANALSAVSICDDPKATAAAKVSAVNSLLRADGFFEKRETSGDKELHELSGQELAARLAKALRSWEGVGSDDDNGNQAGADVFD